LSDSGPLDVQCSAQGPGSQLGWQTGPECSHRKLQLVPEHSITQSRRSVHPELQT
jgi:hypothetical protein